MSSLSSSRISEPQDWQAFERASEVLWSGVLKSEVTMLGISGQEQHGVDLTGYRDGNVAHLVGVQCKCKKPGKDLKEDDLRAEVEKALRYKPPLREFILTTTGRDDAKLTMLANRPWKETTERSTGEACSYRSRRRLNSESRGSPLVSGASERRASTSSIL